LSDDVDTAAGCKSRGAAVGPDWTNALSIHGSKKARLCYCHYIMVPKINISLNLICKAFWEFS